MFFKTKPESVLFITLDSCRYDTFIRSEIPHMRSVGSVYRCMAPGNFTYSSHAAMFMGFTPGDPASPESFINPMVGKIFKMRGGGFSGSGNHKFILDGENIIAGFKMRSYYCLGTGALFWFDPSRRTGQALTRDFHDFFFPGNIWHLEKQLSWLNKKLAKNDRPVFIFLNIGETHFPYYHLGAEWKKEYNPCQPMGGEDNDAQECRRRQRICLEYIDASIAPLLQSFSQSNIIITADHGDCWGENNLWGHGMHHEKIFEVPLIFNLTPDYDSDRPLFKRIIERIKAGSQGF